MAFGTPTLQTAPRTPAAPTPVAPTPVAHGFGHPRPQMSAPPRPTPAPVQPQAPFPTTPHPSAPAPTPMPFAPGVNTFSTNPQSDLRGQTITPGPMADRLGIARTYEQNWNASAQPQYQADIRSLERSAAGAGQIGSGQFRTSLGNLAYNRDLQRNASESNFLNNALGGTIDDAYKNIGIAQQQQQFQAGLQNQTFSQGLQQLLAGNSGSPADTQLALSGIYSNNANQAGQGLNSMIGNTVQNNAQQGLLQQILSRLGGMGAPAGGTSTPLPTGTPIFNTGAQYGGVTG